LSIHPERIEASHERKTPYFSKKKLGPNETITNEEKERKSETAKTKGKMRIFLGDVQNVLISCGLERFKERARQGFWLY
jgi:hypothetical protein